MQKSPDKENHVPDHPLEPKRIAMPTSGVLRDLVAAYDLAVSRRAKAQEWETSALRAMEDELLKESGLAGHAVQRSWGANKDRIVVERLSRFGTLSGRNVMPDGRLKMLHTTIKIEDAEDLGPFDKAKHATTLRRIN
jgi:hypothetical protein